MLLKATLFFILFIIFFGVFGVSNEWLLRFSRTAAVTMLTFVAFGILMMTVYGGYDIGVRKSKPIIASMSLSAIITDISAHLMLCIMNTNEINGSKFIYQRPLHLILVMILQIVVIAFYTYLGNEIFFRVNDPEKSCVITTSKEALNNIVPKIKQFSKQYKICDAVLFTENDVFDVINRNDTVFLYDLPASQRAMFTEYCYQYNKNIYYNFEMMDIVALRAHYSMFDDKPVMSSHVKKMTMEQRIVKRAMDIIISSFALLLFSPVLFISSLAIKLEDGGSIIYKQKRATIHGRVFNVYKFRSMKEDRGFEHKSVIEGDDRITKVGRILRKYRIDEFPQFINVLRGEMTIVGPRPEMVENIEKYTLNLKEFEYRTRMKAGITGLAQISGKYNTVPKDKLVLDMLYIENFNIWFDIKIIFRTLMVFFRATDATESFSEFKRVEYDFCRKEVKD